MFPRPTPLVASFGIIVIETAIRTDRPLIVLVGQEVIARWVSGVEGVEHALICSFQFPMRANVDPVRVTDIKDRFVTSTGRSWPRTQGTVAHIVKLRINTHLDHGGYRCTQVVVGGAKLILPRDLHGHINAGVIVLALKLGSILIVSILCKRQPKGRFNAQHIHPIIQITIEGGGSCCQQTLPRLGTDMSWFGRWHCRWFGRWNQRWYCFC